MIQFFLFCFGLLIGSFLNVVIYRFHTGLSLVHGRSNCQTCSYRLRWFDLLPVFSFLLLRGKCRKCKVPISSQYILVEFGTAVMFLLFGFVDTNSFSLLSTESLITLLIHICIVSVLVVIFVYDLRHMIIPDEFSLALLVLSVILLLKIFYFSESVLIVISHFLSSLVGAGFLWFLWFVSNGRWMGFGDVKLMVGLGLLNSLPQGLSGFVFAFWIGAVFSLIHLGYSRLRRSSKKITMKTEIPFAPFLILGSILAFLMGSDIFHLSYLFS